MTAAWFLIVPLLIGGLYVAIERLFFFHPRTIADVIAGVQRIDDAEVEDLMDPKKETNLCASLSADRFKEEQRRRSRLLFEYLRRMAFNALVLLCWAHAEEDRFQISGSPEDVKRANAIKAIIGIGIQFRFYVLLTRAKLCLWITFDRWVMPGSGLAPLRTMNERDGIKLYRDLIAAADDLSACYGDDCRLRLAVALRG